MRRQTQKAIADDFGGANFGDLRLTARLESLAEAVDRRPSDSFPKLAKSDAELEGTYRFLNNPRVGPEAILGPHVRGTVARAAVEGTVLVVHDTSVFLYSGEEHRPGLGFIKSGQGFVGHFAMAVTADGLRKPLGLLGFLTIFRDERRRTHGMTYRERFADPNKERLKWTRLAEISEGHLDGAAAAIHVMDREADSFELISRLLETSKRFVIRGTWDRRLESWTKANRVMASDELAKVDDVLEREVRLSRRSSRLQSGTMRRIHPAREGRMARLRVRATTVRIKRQTGPEFWHLPRGLTVNLVRVSEVDAPKGEAPVEWLLLTTEPIKTKKQIAAVVDHYRARWIIEDYFKALKTGCAFEKRQLENRLAIQNALALFAPVAWRLLALRSLARAEAKAPASTVLTPLQLKLLRWKSKRVPVAANPTAYEAMLAVAGLGGHLKRNGDPGWQTLGRGYHDLLLLEAGWAARDEM